uniref:Uncharacterized protein n=1 Tax=Rhizophora mucronata TaxID=61149 RepID=A0A2P2J696_RHIMU
MLDYSSKPQIPNKPNKAFTKHRTLSYEQNIVIGNETTSHLKNFVNLLSWLIK